MWVRGAVEPKPNQLQRPITKTKPLKTNELM